MWYKDVPHCFCLNFSVIFVKNIQMKYYCDNQRHLVCHPYSVENLHLMASDLDIKRHWFHGGKNPHYDIPKRRIREIQSKCEIVSPSEILNIIKGKNMEHIIDGEQAYPIHKFSIIWEEDGEHNEKYPESFMYKGMPPGRIKNSTGFSVMLETEMTKSEQKEYIEKWWKNYVDKSDKNPVFGEFTVTLFYETWNCSWFQHETFDKGQTDREVLQSFEKYVRRHEAYQGIDFVRNLSKEDSKTYVSLMGAEDRWRWRGSNTEQDEEGNSPAPFRCAKCKSAGKIRIDH